MRAEVKLQNQLVAKRGMSEHLGPGAQHRFVAEGDADNRQQWGVEDGCHVLPLHLPTAGWARRRKGGGSGVCRSHCDVRDEGWSSQTMLHRSSCVFCDT